MQTIREARLGQLFYGPESITSRLREKRRLDRGFLDVEKAHQMRGEKKFPPGGNNNNNKKISRFFSFSRFEINSE